MNQSDVMSLMLIWPTIRQLMGKEMSRKKFRVLLTAFEVALGSVVTFEKQ